MQANASARKTSARGLAPGVAAAFEHNQSMASNTGRKEAIREYKERKTPRGIFSVKCVPTGQVWAGSSANLDAARNGLWFALRIGMHRNTGLQSTWNQHGEEAFEYDVVEKFEDDLAPMTLKDLYKARTRHWLDSLGAKPIV